MEKILLVFSKKFGKSDLYLIPKDQVKDNELALIEDVAEAKIPLDFDDISDQLYEKILCVQSSVSNNDSYFPSSVPNEWRAKFSEFKVPANSLSNSLITKVYNLFV